MSERRDAFVRPSRFEFTAPMKSPISIYLDDHIAGAQSAIELLQSLGKEYGGESLGTFARRLHDEVQKDLELLEGLANRFGDEGSKPLKKVLARITAKGFRVKLHREINDGLGTLETLELLALGILGKRALWRALHHVRLGDRRLKNENFQQLAKRAQDQHDEVEKFRLALARSVFIGQG